MKISKEDFLEMQVKYKKEVKNGKPGNNKKGEVTDQTEWLFFDRETIERVLSKADPDPKKGGIQFFLGEYSADTAQKYHPQNPEKYEGRLTIIMSPATLEGDTVRTLDVSGDGSLENVAKQCPPECNI